MVLLLIHMLQCIPMVAFMLIHPFLRVLILLVLLQCLLRMALSRHL
uniref:DNA-binding protein EMBP-1 n=1 Tax=Rhizophora mucronata TaxID=61149 RepID=A0A2P2MHR0_RHIMU